MPASEVRTVSANAARNPICSATATKVAISAMGSISSPKIAHFNKDIPIPWAAEVVGVATLIV